MDHAHGVGAAPAPDEYHPYEEAENRWSIPRIVLAVASVAATVFFALTFIATGELLFLGLTLVAAVAAGAVFLWDEGRSAVHRVYHSVWGVPVPAAMPQPIPIIVHQSVPVVVPQPIPVVGRYYREPPRIVTRSRDFAPSAPLPPVQPVGGDSRVPVGDHRPVGIPVPISPPSLFFGFPNSGSRISVGDHRPVGLPRPTFGGDERINVGDHRRL